MPDDEPFETLGKEPTPHHIAARRWHQAQAGTSLLNRRDLTASNESHVVHDCIVDRLRRYHVVFPTLLLQQRTIDTVCQVFYFHANQMKKAELCFKANGKHDGL